MACEEAKKATFVTIFCDNSIFLINYLGGCYFLLYLTSTSTFTDEGLSCYEWVNMRYNRCLWNLIFGNWFHFTQFVLGQQLNRVNISYKSRSFKILYWCLHIAEPSKNKWIYLNEECDFKLWRLLSGLHLSAPRHTTTGEPSEHWDVPTMGGRHTDHSAETLTHLLLPEQGT